MRGWGPDETNYIAMWAVRELDIDKFTSENFFGDLQQKDALQGDENIWKICCINSG